MSSERLLVWLKPQYLGDAVMATPLIDGLIAKEIRPSLLVGPAVKQVLLDRADKVDFLIAENLSNPLRLLKQAATLRKLRFQTALIVNRSFRSAVAARLAGIRRRVGHDTEGRGWLLTDSRPYPPESFEADCYVDLALIAGYELPSLKPSLSVSPDEMAAGKALLGEATVGVQPGARYKSKQIPLPVMAQVVKHLQGEGHTVAMFGGKEEAVHGEELRRMVGGPLVNMIGTTSLRETIGAMANLNLMIGSDTGAMHLAAAVGCPTVTVFGPNPISKWGYAYPPHCPIRAPGGKLENLTADEILGALRVSE